VQSGFNLLLNDFVLSGNAMMIRLSNYDLKVTKKVNGKV